MNQDDLAYINSRADAVINKLADHEAQDRQEFANLNARLDKFMEFLLSHEATDRHDFDRIMNMLTVGVGQAKINKDQIDKVLEQVSQMHDAIVTKNKSNAP